MSIPCDLQSKSWICPRNSCNVSQGTCTEMIFAAMWFLALIYEGNLVVYLWETCGKMWRKPAVQDYGTFRNSQIYTHILSIYSYTTDTFKKDILSHKAPHLDMSRVLAVWLPYVLQQMNLESLCRASSRGP